MRRTYTELLRHDTFEKRYHYLALRGRVGEATFGHERWLNQDFYRSAEWKRARRDVIARDLGCDLGIDGYEIFADIRVHHMNPMTRTELRHGDSDILNPEYLITVSHRTHNAIHYGDESLLAQPLVERTPGDTVPWR